LFPYSIGVGVEITREHDCEVIRSLITMIKRSLFRESPDYYVEDLDFEEVDLVEVTHKESHEIYVSILNTGYGADRMRMVDVGVLLSNYPNPRPTVRILKTTVTLSSKSKTILSPK
jgi:hypothetical protein